MEKMGVLGQVSLGTTRGVLTAVRAGLARGLLPRLHDPGLCCGPSASVSARRKHFSLCSRLPTGYIAATLNRGAKGSSGRRELEITSVSDKTFGAFTNLGERLPGTWEIFEKKTWVLGRIHNNIILITKKCILNALLWMESVRQVLLVGTSLILLCIYFCFIYFWQHIL